MVDRRHSTVAAPGLTLTENRPSLAAFPGEAAPWDYPHTAGTPGAAAPCPRSLIGAAGGSWSGSSPGRDGISPVGSPP